MTKFFHSFGYALKGIGVALEQRNMKIHMAATVAVVLLARALQVSFGEWVALLLSIGLVLSAELLNSALEEICDILTREDRTRYKHMGKPKDIGAGAVLVTAVVAFSIACGVFLPHLIRLFQ